MIPSQPTQDTTHTVWWYLRWLGLLLLVMGARTAVAAPAHFRDAGTVLKAIGLDALSAEERAFVAGLPVIRVAIARPALVPYETINGNEISGIHVEMLLAIGRSFGLRMQPVVLPDWPSAQLALKQKEVDVLLSVGVTPERLDDMAFTLGATPAAGTLFSRPGFDATDLTTARFALERGYIAVDHIRRQYPKASITLEDTTGAALAAVAAGRADVYLGSLLEAAEWLRAGKIAGVVINRPFPYATGHYHFGVRKDWAMLASILNKGIQATRIAPPQGLRDAFDRIPGATLPAALALSPQEQQTLAGRSVWRVGAERGLALLNNIDGNGNHTGIAAEYTEQIAQRLGVGIEVVGFDTTAAMVAALRNGSIDVIPFFVRSPDRLADFAFSTAYLEMPYVLLGRSGGPLYWDLESLNGKRIALFANHPMREVVRRRAPLALLVETTDNAQAAAKVLSGEADASVQIKLLANYQVNGDPTGQLRILGPVHSQPATFHFAALHSNPSLLPLINRALADIPDNERSRILQRWIAVDLLPGFHWQRHWPAISIGLAGLFSVGLLTAWWMRRLSAEVARRRRADQLLTDIATSVPGVAFRHERRADGVLTQNFVTPGVTSFLGLEFDRSTTLLDQMASRFDQVDRDTLQDRHDKGAALNLTLPYAHPNGHPRWLHVEALRTQGAHDGHVWTGFIVDITSEHDLQIKLTRSAESRSLMLASASHELRAPTHTLALALQSVRGDSLSAQDRASLDVARDAALHLTQLLGDVLDAARAQTDGLRLRLQTVALHGLLNDIAAAWRSAARSKGLQFELLIGPAVPPTAMLDPLRLRQVLTNLLSNACKYTRHGGVSLQANIDSGPETAAPASPAHPAGPHLVLRIGDTGIGIAESDQAALFRPFTTVGSPADVPEGRSGLGLAICIQLVQLMGGTITLDSALGKGTMVKVRMPLTLATLTTDPASAAAPAMAAGTVIVCDDDDTSRLLMSHMLERIGFKVQDSPDGEHTLALWRAGGVRAIVTDIDMPSLSGIDLMQTVRSEEAGHHQRTALIVCSGSDAPVVTDQPGAAVIYDAYLVKPVSMVTLTETLTTLGLKP